jgi:hypothetical protein
MLLKFIGTLSCPSVSSRRCHQTCKVTHCCVFRNGFQLIIQPKIQSHNALLVAARLMLVHDITIVIKFPVFPQSASGHIHYAEA